MKQLKFMLAAATAVGFAAVAQAATEVLSSENFDGYDTDEEVVSIDGFSFNGAEGDNESAIVAESENDKALKVNTGTDPLLRMVDTKYRQNVNLADDDFNSLNIDATVQFTVTPVGDTVTATADDKLMIFLKEVAAEEEGGESTTALKVKATKFQPAGVDEDDEEIPETNEPDDYDVKYADGSAIAVSANTPYLLTVKTVMFNGEPMFEIYIDGKQVVPVETLNLNAATTAEANYFPALTAGKNNTTLTYVGFAGEGTVDDLVVTRDYNATSVDFTLALGKGVSAVEWTINGNKKNDADSASFDAGTTIVVSIDSVTYEAGYAGTQDWTAWAYNKAESGSIEITAEKFAEVSDTGVVTPTDATIEAVTGGSFKVPAVGGDVTAEEVAEATANLGKALTWATASGKGGKSYTAAIEAINTMNFVDDNETTTEQAYLLDCSTGELGGENGEIAKFKFAGFDLVNGFTVGADPTKQAADGGAYGNGFVVVRGSATINGAYNEAADTAKHNFFKAFLVPFAPAK